MTYEWVRKFGWGWQTDMAQAVERRAWTAKHIEVRTEIFYQCLCGYPAWFPPYSAEIKVEQLHNARTEKSCKRVREVQATSCLNRAHTHTCMVPNSIIFFFFFETVSINKGSKSDHGDYSNFFFLYICTDGILEMRTHFHILGTCDIIYSDLSSTDSPTSYDFKLQFIYNSKSVQSTQTNVIQLH